MSKKSNHRADTKNANKGTPGQNKTHSQVHGNRSKQLTSKSTKKK